MQITCFRPSVVSEEARYLAAPIYNLAVHLREHAPGQTLFIPIRALQYLAIFDREEMVFVHQTQPSLMVLSWRDFMPQRRTALDEPVPYRLEWYQTSPDITLMQLQSALADAVRALQARDVVSPSGGQVLKFPLGGRIERD